MRELDAAEAAEAIEEAAERLYMRQSPNDTMDYYEIRAKVEKLVKRIEWLERDVAERMAVNVGIIRENDDLKRKLAGQS